MAITRLIDVSWWQGQINWIEVGRTVYRGGICRMTRGGKGVDETGRRNLQGELDHLPVAGGYGVVGTSEPVEDGAKQLLDEIAAVTDPKGVLVMLDAENFAKLPDGTVPHSTIDQVDRYARQIRAELGRWPIAYVPDWWLDQWHYSVAGRSLANCPWAPSEYLSAPWTDERLIAHKPSGLHGFATLSHLQYASSATVAGITGRVDANCYYGTLDQLKETIGIMSATGPASWDEADWAKWRERQSSWLIGGTLAEHGANNVMDLPADFIAAQPFAKGLAKAAAAAVQVDPPQIDEELLASLLAGKLVIAGVEAEGDRLVITFAPKPAA